VRAERAMNRALQGGCQVPIACYGRIENGNLMLARLVGSVDGKRIIKDSLEGLQSEAERLGVTLAESLLKQGADVILREVYGKSPDYSGNNLLENN